MGRSQFPIPVNAALQSEMKTKGADGASDRVPTDAALPQDPADGFPSRLDITGLSLFAHDWKKQGKSTTFLLTRSEGWTHSMEGILLTSINHLLCGFGSRASFLESVTSKRT